MERRTLLAVSMCVGLAAGCGNTPPAGGDDLGGGQDLGGQDLGGQDLGGQDLGGRDLGGGLGQDLKGSGGDDMTVVVSAAQACAAFAAAFCNQLLTCDSHELTLSYGDMATCVARQQINCPLRFKVAGTPNGLMDCANAYAGASCADIFQNNPPMACRPAAGALADGAVCGLSGQCQSSYCPIDASSGCGKCVARLQTGTCSVNEDCDYGLVCPVLGTGKCATTLGMGAACSVDIRCKWGMGCIGGKCATYLTLGADCPAGTGCDVHHGLYCNAMKKCDAVKYAMAGEMCGALAAGETQCRAGAVCKLVPNTKIGTCVAPVMDGGKCSADPSLFMQCMHPAGCESGTCKVPDPTSCH